MIVFLNGKYVPETKAHISIHDHGFLYGDGVYETMRVYGGKVFQLDQHLDRLKHSLKGIGLKIPLSVSKIGQAIQQTVKRNNHREAAVRLTITRGPATRLAGKPGRYGFDPRPCKTPTIAVVSRPFSGFSESAFQKGMTAAIVSVRRNSPEALPPSIKSTSCLNNILAKMEANRLNADEAILLGDDGTVAEGTVSNIFVVKEGQLLTPVLDGRQLAGVTRELVCQLARKEKIRVSETKITLLDLSSAEELFLTSSLMEIMPISRLVSDIQTPSHISKSVGPITRKLQNCYKRFTRS